MRHAYLILAHEDAVQLEALVRRLAPPGGPDRAIVHIDAKSALWHETRGRFLGGIGTATVIPNPVKVRWGHASQIAATRLLLAEALREDFAVAHLLSGADWPLAPRETILAEAVDACHIEAAEGVQSERMERVRLDSRMLRPDPAKPWQWYPARALRRLSTFVPARKAGPWGAWHKGSQWWSLPRDVCGAVLTEIDRAFASGLLAGTLCADEHLIQTIVAARFPARIAPNRRFVRWSSGASPDVLTGADWDAAKASGAWFARKLSRTRDPFFLAAAGTAPPLAARSEDG